jgi:hypothetical protein
MLTYHTKPLHTREEFTQCLNVTKPPCLSDKDTSLTRTPNKASSCLCLFPYRLLSRIALHHQQAFIIQHFTIIAVVCNFRNTHPPTKLPSYVRSHTHTYTKTRQCLHQTAHPAHTPRAPTPLTNLLSRIPPPPHPSPQSQQTGSPLSPNISRSPAPHPPPSSPPSPTSPPSPRSNLPAPSHS